MHRFWDPIVKPILTIVKPRSIVEIGSEIGKSTVLLLEYCSQYDANLNSIDPLPLFDVDELAQKYSGKFIFHRDLSLNALPDIARFDMVFIDGDHNWYTVFNELELIKNQCQKNNMTFPLVFLHDVGWPYGRRDLYYNPENIPSEYRKPFEKKGMVPGDSGLLDLGGLNADLFNATHENGPRNGVRTAIEDFLDSSPSLGLELIIIPGLYGLGILYPTKLRNNPDFDQFITGLDIKHSAQTFIENVETDRILKQLAINRRNDELTRISQKVENILKNYQTDVKKKETQLKEKRNQLRDLEKKLNWEVEKNKVLTRYLEKIETDFLALLDSKRWKIGNRFGDLIQKLMFKPNVPLASHSILKQFDQYHGWLHGDGSDGESPGDNYLDHLKSQCRKLIPIEKVDRILKVLANGSVTIVVPIFNAFDETKRCIESILEFTSIPYELLLINDCSTDQRIADLLKSYQDISFVQTITNKENLGFVKTANLGIAAAGHDVVLLNSDTMVTARWMQKLIIAAYTTSETATVTPFSNASGAFSVPEIGKNEPIYPYLTTCGMGHLVERTSESVYPDVPTGNGFCMYIKREVIKDIGIFDEQNFKKGYGEENDFCMRAAEKGWKHIIDDSTFIYHKNSASFSNNKEKLIKENRKVLDRLHPEYTELVRKFINSAEIRRIREKIRSQMRAIRTRRHDLPRILYVMHEGTGGTPATNEDLMQHISMEFECFLLTSTATHLIVRYIGNGTTTRIFSYKLSEVWSAQKFESQEFRMIYFSLLVHLHIEIVHIRHLFKHCFELPELCRNLGLGLVFSFHDFYHICPSIHLLNHANRYCQAECNGDRQCRIPTALLNDLPRLRDWVPLWREKVRQMLKQCNILITTTNSAKDLYLKVYPELEVKRFQVIEHGRDFPDRGDGCATPPGTQSAIKILIPGNIDIHKGSQFIKALSDQDTADRLEFHFMGSVPKDLQGVGVDHGPYERHSFQKKVSAISPSFVGIFSICPETYCHTLTEAWASGIPVLGFNIGAVGERILQTGGGWFLDMEDIASSYERILDIAGSSSEYQKVVSLVEKIPFKTTKKMADEYINEYYTALSMLGTQKPPVKTISLFTPQGGNGFPGSSWVRCLLPLRHPDVLRRFTLKVMPENLSPETIDSHLSAHSPDYILVQRDVLTGNKLEAVLSWCRNHRVPLVYELDDDLMGIDASHPDYDIYLPKLKAVEKLCKNAVLTTVSTDELQKSLAPYSSQVKVMKNALDEHLWLSPLPSARKKISSRQISIGYMGTFTHKNDLHLLGEVIPEVKSVLSRKYDIKMDFFMIGGQKDNLIKNSWYQRIDIPGSKSQYPIFVEWLRQHFSCDIAVAPLEYTKLNNSKSELKFLEYTVLGAAGVYSDCGAYKNSVLHRQNGLLVKDNDIEKWKSYLIELSVDDNLRQTILSNALETVTKNYLLKERSREWIRLFDSIESHGR